jgi:hypothetical protein
MHIEPELGVRMQVAAPGRNLLVHGGDAVHDRHGAPLFSRLRRIAP